MNLDGEVAERGSMHPCQCQTEIRLIAWYVPLTPERLNNFATPGTWQFMRQELLLLCLGAILDFEIAFEMIPTRPWTL